MSVVANLDDHCFVLATTLVAELCSEVERTGGEKPTITDLCELLTWGLRSCSLDLLADVNVQNITGLRPKLKKRGKVILQPGDVVTIPSQQRGKYRLAVYITKNRFGYAFGVVRGEHPARPLPPTWEPKILPHPFYTGYDCIASGRWHVVGRDAHLLSLFPKHPESYHYKEDWPEDDSIGPFGSAESPRGQLRTIDKQEAELVGLTTREYSHGMSGQAFEWFIETRLASFQTRKRRTSNKSATRPSHTRSQEESKG